MSAIQDLGESLLYLFIGFLVLMGLVRAFWPEPAKYDEDSYEDPRPRETVEQRFRNAGDVGWK